MASRSFGVVVVSLLVAAAGVAAAAAAVRRGSVAATVRGRWVELAAAPTARAEVSAARVGAEAYVVGGFDRTGSTSALVQRLELRTGRWGSSPPLPVARSSFQAVAVAGSIVVVGGEGPQGTIGEVDSLDPTTDKWQRLANLPTARHGLGLVGFGHRVWAIDGGPEPGLTSSATVELLQLTSRH